jgi:hypothetical protein
VLKKAFILAGTSACDLETTPNHGTGTYRAYDNDCDHRFGSTECEYRTPATHNSFLELSVSFSPFSFYYYTQLLLQSYDLVKKISKTNGVPAKEFVWALQADVECCEKIKKMFRWFDCLDLSAIYPHAYHLFF